MATDRRFSKNNADVHLAWTSELSVRCGLGQTPKDVDEEDVHVFVSYLDWVFGLVVRSFRKAKRITNNDLIGMVKRTTRLQGSKQKKDDEYYTLFQDIADEVSLYLPQLRGKRILCPCDWDESYNEEIVYK